MDDQVVPSRESTLFLQPFFPVRVSGTSPRRLSGVCGHSVLPHRIIDNDYSNKDIYDNFLSLDVNKEAIINQTKVIKKIANNSNAIIVGRASDYILRDNTNLIKIFIYATLDYRVKNIMNNYGDNKKQALKNILNSDKSRSNYYSAISNKKWGEKNNYDLYIDATIENENVVKTICDYINKKC